MVYGGAYLTMGRDVGLTPPPQEGEDKLISRDVFDFQIFCSSSTIFRRTLLLEREDGKDACAYHLFSFITVYNHVKL